MLIFRRVYLMWRGVELYLECGQLGEEYDACCFTEKAMTTLLLASS